MNMYRYIADGIVYYVVDSIVFSSLAKAYKNGK